MDDSSTALSRTTASRTTGPGADDPSANSPRALFVLAPRDPAAAELQDFLSVNGYALRGEADALLSDMSADSLGLLDLRVLEQGHALPLPAECLLGRGRWLLINAQEPFRDDFLLFNAGVCGVLSFREAPARVLQALELIAQGELWIPRAILAEAFQRQRARHTSQPAVLPALTRREWQVLRGLLVAENNREIAARLGVEESTVKRHLYNLFRKVGVRNRLEALNWARAAGLQAGQEFRPANRAC